MEQEKIDHFRNKLEEEKTDLEKRLGEFAEPPAASGGEWQPKFPNRQEGTGHDANEESADESEEYGANIALTKNLARQLEDVDLALGKIKNGTYGKCENCDKDVPIDRLEIFPAARFCFTCDGGK